MRNLFWLTVVMFWALGCQATPKPYQGPWVTSWGMGYILGGWCVQGPNTQAIACKVFDTNQDGVVDMADWATWANRYRGDPGPFIWNPPQWPDNQEQYQPEDD